MRLGNFQDFLKHAEFQDGCLVWQRAKSSAGYGQFWDGEKVQYVHRAVANLFYEKPDDKDMVLHSCDNPSCCNPAHLRWGDSRDNTQDMLSRNRHNPNPNRGDKHHNSRVTANQVAEIRKKRSEGMYLKDIAAEFGTTLSNVHLICSNKRWRENA